MSQANSEERSSLLGAQCQRQTYNTISSPITASNANDVEESVSNESDLISNSRLSDSGELENSIVLTRTLKGLSREEWLVLVTQNCLIFTSAIAYSLLFTFFPQTAAEKGANSMTIGLIFGIYEFVIFLTSPVFGALTEKLTPRYMCLAGSFLSGSCCLLFGFLQWCPGDAIFVVMCFLVRIVDAAGASMSNVSSFAILSVTFPRHVAVVNSMAETVAGLGLMLGPVIGAFLYDTGGFLLPFVVVGSLSLISTVFAFFGPSDFSGGTEKRSRVNLSSILRNPGIALIYVHVFGATVALTFLDPIMSQWLVSNFTLSVTMVGLVFLIWSGVYTVVSPAMGKLTEKGFIYSMMISGSIVCFLSLLFIGPSPLLQALLPAEKQLWLVCLSCVFLGLACAAMFIPPYIAALNLVEADNHSLDAKVYGMISGLISSAGSLGAFAGPSLAGYLNDQWGFEWSLTACAFIVLSVALLMIIFCIVMKLKGKELASHTTEEKIVANTKSRKTEDLCRSQESEEIRHLIQTYA